MWSLCQEQWGGGEGLQQAKASCCCIKGTQVPHGESLAMVRSRVWGPSTTVRTHVVSPL